MKVRWVVWSQNFGFLIPMRKKCENRLKETQIFINMCQNSSCSLGDRKRKILKDYGSIGRVVALRNIQSEVEEKSMCVFVCLFV